MSGVDRKQFLRIDCPECHGNGYVTKNGAEQSCEKCGASGLLEKEVAYKFDTNGYHTPEEVAEAFGIPVEQVKDKGHSVGD